MTICTYNSSQPIIPYYASTLENYGFYAGLAVGAVATPIFLIFGVGMAAIENPKPDVNYRLQAFEVLGLGAIATPAIGWIAGKALGTLLDYVSYYAQTFYCIDVTKNNK